MRKVFEHPASHEVGHYASILESHGIKASVRNENASSLVGEVPFVAAYPELWVLDDDDYERAIALLAEYRSAQPSGDAWTCPECGESVPGTFSGCWRCQALRPNDSDDSPPVVEAAPRSSTATSPTRFPLTLACTIIATIVFGWSLVAPAQAFFLFAPDAIAIYRGRWDGFLGSPFMHGDIMHLVFNLYWLWVFGTVLEAHLRRGMWLLLFGVSAVFASAAQLAFGGGSIGIGLSGVIYAFFGFLWFAGPRYPAFKEVLTRNRRILLLGWLVVCFGLTRLNILPIANAAHVGGLVAGALLGWAYCRSQRVVVIAGAALILPALGATLYAPWSISFHGARTSALLEHGKTEEAIVALERVIDDRGPFSGWATHALAEIRQWQGDHPAAAKLFEDGLPQLESDPKFLNAYAWFLATSPDDRVRDGNRAVELARDAAEITAWNDAAILDTLAAAYAEAGDFPSAVKMQTRVVAMLDVPDTRQHLDLFRDGKPVRSSVVNASGGQ